MFRELAPHLADLEPAGRLRRHPDLHVPAIHEFRVRWVGRMSAKRVLLTGASTGIGNATLQRLVAAGHDVTTLDVKDAPEGSSRHLLVRPVRPGVDRRRRRAARRARSTPSATSPASPARWAPSSSCGSTSTGCAT